MKLKVFLPLIAVLGFATTAAYADGTQYVNVTGNISTTAYNLNGQSVTHIKLTDATSQSMSFTMKVAPNAPAPVAIYCWNKNGPTPSTYNVQPGQSFQCTTDGDVRFSGVSNMIITGTYAVTLVDSK